MKHGSWLGIILVTVCALMGCVSHSYPYLANDLTQERWMAFVDRNASLWSQGADRWFLEGHPNEMELASRQSSYDRAISTTMVRVPPITKLIVNGNFQVQLFGAKERNTTFLYGPNEEIRNISVQINGDQLVVTQANIKLSAQHVIVRIGVCNLVELVQHGVGTIEGIHLQSRGLSVSSSNIGNIYLSGNLKLQRVINRSSGSITIMNVKSPYVDVISLGAGNINICGEVGVHSIVHHGIGNINIIGANSAGLTIVADGKGKIGIEGTANVSDIKAYGQTNVFVTHVMSHQLVVKVSDQATVGLAGRTYRLNVDASRSAHFLGQNLCAFSAFVKTIDRAHVNIAVQDKIFASGADNSSIYIIGKPRQMSPFVTDYATIVPLAAALRSHCYCG